MRSVDDEEAQCPLVKVLRSSAVAALILSASVALTAKVPTLAIIGVNVVDIVDGRIVPNSTMVVRGDTITAVTQDRTLPASVQRIDGRDKFLVPGLLDMHAHIEGNEKSWLPLYIANGVTGIRDMGADLDFILDEATGSGRILGLASSLQDQILDDAPGDWPFRMRVKTPERG